MLFVVAVGEGVVVSLVDVVVVEGDGEREVVVSVGVELTVVVELGVASSVLVEGEVVVVFSPSRSSHRNRRGL